MFISKNIFTETNVFLFQKYGFEWYSYPKNERIDFRLWVTFLNKGFVVNANIVHARRKTFKKII